MEAPAVRVARTDGEATRQQLEELGVLDRSLEIRVTEDALLIPVTDPEVLPASYDIVSEAFSSRETQTPPAEILGFDPSYERLGDIVILDEDDDDRAAEIAEAVLDADLPVETVLNRASKIKGRQRIREWDVLAGDGTETVHREHGTSFRLDIASVYFSPRLATERHRVTQQVDAEECVFDMFAGVGPYAIPAARRGASVRATDINETAIEYLRANAETNGVADRVSARCGDVREAPAEFEDWTDRIVMNLPHSANEYLDTAFALASDDCVIHYYDIQHDTDPFGPGETALERAAASDYDLEVLERHDVRSYAPHERNVCLDVRAVRR